jgi:transmembrane sensor
MGKSNIVENKNWELLAKYIAGEADQGEKATIESWINESEENLTEFNKCRQIFQDAGNYYLSSRFDEKKALDSVKSQISKVKRIQTPTEKKKFYLPVLKYAAGILLVAATGFLLYWLVSGKPTSLKMNQVVSAPNEIIHDFALPDGSHATLNGNTTILYLEKFNGATREVEIIGEAFFDVKPNPGKPFVITAGNTKIKVVGTSFNVCAYPAGETVEVVVETGKVQFSNPSGNPGMRDEVLLVKGEKATFSKKDKNIQKKTNDDPNYNGWKTQNLVYSKSQLGYVLQNLEKTYHVEIEVADPEIEKLILSAQFNHKSIDFILDVIRLTFNLELTAEGNHYTLSKRN